MKLIPNTYFLQDIIYDTKELGNDELFHPSLVDIKKTQQDLTKNLWNVDFPKSKRDTRRYDELLSPAEPIKPKTFVSIRTNDPDLDDTLENMQYVCYEKKDFTETLYIIDDILKHHEKNLTMQEYIHVIMTKALVYHQTKDRIKIYQELLLIEPYLKHFDNQQLVGFYDFKGNAFLYAWEDTENYDFFPSALDAYNKLLDTAEIHPLEPDVYQRTKFKIAKIFVYMFRDNEAMEIFKELISMPDSLFEGDEIAVKTNKQIKEQSRYYLRMLAEKGGE